MIILNFSHPLTDLHLKQIEIMSGERISRIIAVPVNFDNDKSYAEQVIFLVDRIGLTPRQWQNEAILLNPPSFNYIVVVLLAELHGRMGYFPPCIRLRPVDESLPPRFEVAEILNLNKIRERARMWRSKNI